ncbi:MAG: zf-HC2 domain-containing protein [Chloroflexi bacterium]|nr:zf-HC2 domain-containing protein [Chloroflexota bacterium]
MFNFVRNLTKSEQDRRQEALSAYLDDALSARRRQEFERLLAMDADLRRELELQQQIRRQMQAMPQRSVPRSFTLDPAAYGPPRREPLVRAYPVLRGATALTAVFFVVALAASLFSFNGTAGIASPAPMAQEAASSMEGELAAAPEAAADSARIEEALAADTAVSEAADSGSMAAEESAAFAITENPPETPAEEMGAAGDALALPAATMSATIAPPMPTAMPTPAAEALRQSEFNATAVVSEQPAAPSPSLAAEVNPADAAPTPNEPPQPKTAPTLPTRAFWPLLAVGLGGLLVVLALVTVAARRRQ